jgi:formiminotetrahydrofolate cyclodeaminase
MYAEGRVEAYVADAAARKPAPGGGSVSALAGALAASMSEMCANFTVGKKKFASVQSAVSEMLSELAGIRSRLIALIDEDVRAYEAVDEAMKLPRETDGQRTARRKAMEDALRGAMQPPLEVVKLCARVASISERLVEIGNPNLITDVGVSAILAEAAAAAARLNVAINLKYMEDAPLAKITEDEVDELCGKAAESRREVLRKVELGLTK